MTDLPQRHNFIANDVLIATLADVANTRASSMTAANLGVSPDCIRSRLRSLETVAGGAVYNRGKRGKRLTITPLGRELIAGHGVQDFITTSEAAKILGIERNSANNLCRDGKIKSVKQYGMWKIDPQAFEKFAATYDRSNVAAKSYQPRDGYISTKEAQSILGYKYGSSVVHLIKRGEIEAKKIGKFWYIDEASVRAYKRKPKTRKFNGRKKRVTAVIVPKSKPLPRTNPDLSVLEAVAKHQAAHEATMARIRNMGRVAA